MKNYSTHAEEQRIDYAAFTELTSHHTMHIIEDTPNFRHIDVSKLGDSSYSFKIVTYPNYLIYTGDMGCFIFSRNKDMFDFSSFLQ